MSDANSEEKVTLPFLVNSRYFLLLTDKGHYYEVLMEAQPDENGLFYHHWENYRVPGRII